MIEIFEYTWASPRMPLATRTGCMGLAWEWLEHHRKPDRYYYLFDTYKRTGWYLQDLEQEIAERARGVPA